MMATVPHVTSGSGLRKFQADGFLSDRVYMHFRFWKIQVFWDIKPFRCDILPTFRKNLALSSAESSSLL